MNKKEESNPVRDYRIIVQDGGEGYINRVMIGTATLGIVRVEWTQSRYGQIIPVNWSQVTTLEYMGGYFPLRYQVADAQNLIVKRAIEKDFEWLLLWEHDVIAPGDALLRLNQYIRDEDTPVVSGLYYTRAEPSEPLIFRGRGTSVYTDFKRGELVWASGVPTGFLLIHMGILREMWKESPEYQIKGTVTRRVFDTPQRVYFVEEANQFNTFSGTSDLEWCNRVIQGEYFKKAGWSKYQRKKYPFLVDTNLFCFHINIDGSKFPNYEVA